MKKLRFSSLDLIAAFTLAAVTASLAVPRYRDHVIRGKVADAMVVARDAQAAVAEAAAAAGGLTALQDVDFDYRPSTATQHVAAVAIEGSVIKIRTRDTGARIDPHLRWIPFQSAPGAPLSWSCALQNAARAKHLPPGCESRATTL